MIVRVHKIRLDPTAEQAKYFARACGVARFAYNWALAEWKRQHEAGGKPNEAALRKQLNAIKAVEFPWMAEVTKCAPQVAIKNVGLAFDHFFRRVTLGQKPGYPRFKRKGIRDSFRADNGPVNASSHAVQVVSKTVKLPRCGVVRMREELRFAGRVLGATVSRTADGWYVALAVETEERLKAAEDRGAVGVDLGIKTLATFSNGSGAPALKPHHAEHKRIVRLSRSLSRKQKGSANRAKAKTKLARLHLSIANVRKDALHKLTTTLATNYSTIGIEDLNVSGMLKNGKLARAIADAGFFEFRRQLEYKAAMTGAQVIVIDRFYPSSKTCSGCGAIHAITLSDRVIECGCGLKMDRDLNAAINIRRQALAQQSVERKALADASATVKPASVKQKKSALHRNVQAA
ncbi:RNA-guided endonuclease TnpB family protein [Paraburkholderia sp. RL18-103-BIB-C]|uniref:RNA-guided endonuclease InsQ/TnpB family protein n=1 Tax=Paraburkholderia sp. RL18-103-BIB-C TaxID=3031637 RepID=UPI0038BC7BB0